jgi:septal ring factor EnvC (AmiA/AmiB activator)
LIHEWSYTIEKLESTQITLKTYQKQANEYSLLVDGLENKINLLEAKDSLLNSSLNASENKNTVLQDIIENRNKKIKQIKTQRNIVTGVAVLVIVISLI